MLPEPTSQDDPRDGDRTTPEQDCSDAPPAGGAEAFQTRHQEWIVSLPGFSGWNVSEGKDGRPQAAVYLVDGHPSSEREIRDRLADEATVEFVRMSAPFEFGASPAQASDQGLPPGKGPA